MRDGLADVLAMFTNQPSLNTAPALVVEVVDVEIDLADAVDGADKAKGAKHKKDDE